MGDYRDHALSYDDQPVCCCSQCGGPLTPSYTSGGWWGHNDKDCIKAIGNQLRELRAAVTALTDGARVKGPQSP